MYKLTINSFNEKVIIRDNNNGSFTSFTEDLANTDYQAYLKYKEEGGKVYGPDEEVPTGG